jgi:hypothetical protein
VWLVLYLALAPFELSRIEADYHAGDVRRARQAYDDEVLRIERDPQIMAALRVKADAAARRIVESD